jgi:transcriptional regulator with XRE-family HTH domain
MTKASTTDLAVLGERMKMAREAVGLSQKELCEKFGYVSVSVRTYQKNEAGHNEAGISLARTFVRAGINANWLLTGEGPMRLADITPTVAGTLDPARLRFILQTVEEGLAAAGRAMAPDKKAELVVAIYDLCEEASLSKEKVLKLVKLAA